MLKNAAQWIKQECKFAQYGSQPSYISETDRDMKPTYVQWMTSDNKIFFPAAEVTKQLRPGYYEPKISMQGGLFFERLPLGGEPLVKFPEMASDMVIDEIETFWNKEDTFRDARLAYKRGILLYGPAGSGKTSTIKIVIQNLIKREGVVMRFGSPGSFTEGMKTLREIQPKTPIVALMEDIDALLDRHNESDIINILDGVVPIDKIIFLATTNYPERLGSRIMNRPSRFDKRFEIGMPNAESRRIYLKSLLGEKLADKELSRWVEDTDGLTIAHLKELVVAVTILGDKYENAIKTLAGMRAKIVSDESLGRYEVRTFGGEKVSLESPQGYPEETAKSRRD